MVSAEGELCISSASLSQVGASDLQWPHHGAKNLTNSPPFPLMASKNVVLVRSWTPGTGGACREGHLLLKQTRSELTHLSGYSICQKLDQTFQVSAPGVRVDHQSIDKHKQGWITFDFIQITSDCLFCAVHFTDVHRQILLIMKGQVVPDRSQFLAMATPTSRQFTPSLILTKLFRSWEAYVPWSVKFNKVNTRRTSDIAIEIICQLSGACNVSTMQIALPVSKSHNYYRHIIEVSV